MSLQSILLTIFAFAKKINFKSNEELVEYKNKHYMFDKNKYYEEVKNDGYHSIVQYFNY
ncbi:MAG: hypothetical protein MJB14_07180 [Spirochaetes bacterium]|nr:hypothetical protein [Spirochaetota bacterium]